MWAEPSAEPEHEHQDGRGHLPWGHGARGECRHGLDDGSAPVSKQRENGAGTRACARAGALGTSRAPDDAAPLPGQTQLGLHGPAATSQGRHGGGGRSTGGRAAAERNDSRSYDAARVLRRLGRGGVNAARASQARARLVPRRPAAQALPRRAGTRTRGQVGCSYALGRWLGAAAGWQV